MNYKNIYHQIVLRAQNSNRKRKDGCWEQHHVIPTCIGGTNTPENLVLLSPREHFICHVLLVRFCEPQHKKSLSFAAGMMRSRGKIVSSRTYEFVREAHREAIRQTRLGAKASIETRQKMSVSLRGKTRTEEQKENIRKSQLGKSLSDEHKRKLSVSQKGKPKPHSDEHKQALRGPRGPWTEKQREARKRCAEKIRQAHLGRKCSDETKAKISAARKRKEPLTHKEAQPR